MPRAAQFLSNPATSMDELRERLSKSKPSGSPCGNEGYLEQGRLGLLFCSSDVGPGVAALRLIATPMLADRAVFDHAKAARTLGDHYGQHPEKAVCFQDAAMAPARTRDQDTHGRVSRLGSLDFSAGRISASGPRSVRFPIAYLARRCGPCAVVTHPFCPPKRCAGRSAVPRG